MGGHMQPQGHVQVVSSMVDDGLDPRNYTIANAVDRMERLRADPVLAVLESRPDLTLVLQRLGDELASGSAM